MLTLSQLYDSNQFSGVSQQTRTDIINALGIDIESVTVNEGGIFTAKQLCEGLRYLLATNKNLHIYIEKSSSQSYDSSNPFAISTNDALFIQIVSPSTPSTSTPSNSANCCESSDGCHGSNSEKALFICAGILAVALAFGFCYCSGKNTCVTLKSQESNLVKSAKVSLTLFSFAATFTLAYFLIPSNDVLTRAIFSFPIAAAAASLSSLISKKISCLPKIPKPKKEILDELQPIKRILEGGYTRSGYRSGYQLEDRSGDNKEQDHTFIKEAVRYYIQKISKDKNSGLEQSDSFVEPSTSLLQTPTKNFGSFFQLKDESVSPITTQPLIDTQPLIEKPALSYGN
jgi:hypothetical protein